jgi:hypothetical protein
MPPLETWLLLFIALAQAYSVRQGWRNLKDLRETQANIALLEKNTNSIKDALVASTAKASLAQGTAEGRAAQKAETTKK